MSASGCMCVYPTGKPLPIQVEKEALQNAKLPIICRNEINRLNPVVGIEWHPEEISHTIMLGRGRERVRLFLRPILLHWKGTCKANRPYQIESRSHQLELVSINHDVAHGRHTPRNSVNQSDGAGHWDGRTCCCRHRRKGKFLIY